MSARTQSIVSASERPVLLVGRPVDLDSPFHRVPEARQQAGELVAAPGQQGPDRVVVGIDGGQPERQDRGAARRRPGDDLMVRPADPLDVVQPAQQARQGVLAEGPRFD